MMKKVLHGLGFFCISIGSVVIAGAQSSTPSRIRFIFENPKLQPAQYSIDINEDGTGHFRSEPGNAAAPDPEGITAQPMEADITIDEPLRSVLFKTARSHNFFNVACETTKVKVSFTGKKALQYTGPDGNGSFTVNWALDQLGMKAIDARLAVALALEEVRRVAVDD